MNDGRLTNRQFWTAIVAGLVFFAGLVAMALREFIG
jgi:hypothetical protein